MRRRLTAILAADIVGYSSLVGADQEGTLAALREIRSDLLGPVVAELRGEMVKSRGDGWLVEFASAVDAVTCATQLQERLAGHDRIKLRIGVHIGDVVHEDGDVFGDGVNVAARLEEIAEPGSVAISDSVHGALDGTLRGLFRDQGALALKNIQSPIRVWSTGGIGPGASPAEGVEGPSIAVLPFNNLSSDPDQEYFADGIAEDITTALGRFHWFLVIARNTSFTYKASRKSLPAIARELAVRYILQGSVRKAGERVRVAAQLVDTESGREIWTQRYDGDMTDIFEVQDRIVQAIVGEVAPSFVGAEASRARSKAPQNLDAWDAAMRGNWHFWHMTGADLVEAAALFRRAIELDPRSSTAWSGLALAEIVESIIGFAAVPGDNLVRAQDAAKRAIALDEQNAWPYVALALVHHARRDNARALSACERAVELNPNLAFAVGLLGLFSAHAGAYEEARRNAELAGRLSPRDPAAHFWRLALVIAALVAERSEEYRQRAQELTVAFPEFVPGWRHLAAANAMLGRSGEAAHALEGVFRLSPRDRIGLLAESVPLADEAALQRFLDALRLAGMPE
jgi:adenylate cyclase